MALLQRVEFSSGVTMFSVDKSQALDQQLDDDTDKMSLNKQTSKISWQQLQRFYASGSVIAVRLGVDLIEVAYQFSKDNKCMVEQWLGEGAVYKVDDNHAKQWYENKSYHWAVVVAPWVLVQEVVEDKV